MCTIKNPEVGQEEEEEIMARGRRVYDDEDAAAEAMFLGRPQGGDMAGQLSVMLQLLGMGPQQQQFQEEAGLRREEQEALNAYRMGGLEQAGIKSAADIKLAEAQLQALKDEATARTDEAKAKRAFEQAQLANEQKRAEMGMVIEYIKAHPELKEEQVMGMLGEYSEPIKQMTLAGREQKLGEAARTLLPTIEAAYQKGDPSEYLKTLFAMPGMQETLQRPEIPWQRLNEEMAKRQSGTASGGAGLAGLLWNLPGIGQNVGKGIVNLASRGLMGSQAPQVPYTEFTNPVTEVPRYREAQAVLEALKAPGQSVGPEPEEPMGGYSTGPVAQGQPWTYGTGTRNIPQETIAVPEAMPMPPVGETLSAGVLGMPPVSLGTLLRKLGIGAQGAEAPFGMPGEEEPMPWQYGVGTRR